MQLVGVVDLDGVSGGSGKDKMLRGEKRSKRKNIQRRTKQTTSH
jgi:hypothetical protein